MRINDNISGVAGISTAPREVVRNSKTTPKAAEDSVALEFAARYAEMSGEPGAAEKALALAIRDSSYDPQPQEIASALIGKAFGQ